MSFLDSWILLITWSGVSGEPSFPSLPSTPSLPFSPLIPRSPISPFSPFSPCSPIRPSMPFLPSRPDRPDRPRSPRSPIIESPFSPLSPFVPFKISTEENADFNVSISLFIRSIPAVTSSSSLLCKRSSNSILRLRIRSFFSSSSLAKFPNVEYSWFNNVSNSMSKVLLLIVFLSLLYTIFSWNETPIYSSVPLNLELTIPKHLQTQDVKFPKGYPMPLRQLLFSHVGNLVES